MNKAIISIQSIIAAYNQISGSYNFNRKFPVKDIVEFLLNKQTTNIDECFWYEVERRFSDDEIERLNLENIEIMFHCIIDAVYTVVRDTTGLPDIEFNFIAWSGNDLFIGINNGKDKICDCGSTTDLYHR